MRKQIVERFGTRAIHAAEDGFTVGTLVGFALTVPPIAFAVGAALGVAPSRAGPLALVREVPDLVRGKAARAQESYFAVSFILGAGGSSAVGSFLSSVSIVPL